MFEKWIRRLGGLQDTIKLTGTYRYVLRDKYGKVKLIRTIPNLVPTVGKAAVAGCILTDVATNRFDYIAIGTGVGAAAAGDTTLGTEISTGGGERSAGTGTRVTTTVTNDTAQLVVTFTFTATFAVTEAGVLNAASAGDLLSRQVFSAINVVSGDSLEITWKGAVS